YWCLNAMYIVLYGLVGYFVIGFEVPSYPVYFSTSPQDTPTHWHQRIFFINEPMQVQTGDLCYKNKDCSRSLNIKIEMMLFPLSKESQVLIIPEH
uniref:Protein arginine N-methyltransferase domain-containing protein n=1 Tax=Amphimedon queenslandica TaxID=400682 RepID=A0A1X7UYN0_AMPQE